MGNEAFWTDMEKFVRERERRNARAALSSARQARAQGHLTRSSQEELLRVGNAQNGLIARARRRLHKMSHDIGVKASPVLERLERVSSNNLLGSDMGFERDNSRTRPVATKRGYYEGGGAAGRGGSVKYERGAFSPDKFNQPNADRRDRLSGWHGKQAAGKAGGNWGGFGGSGIKGTASSYEWRSALYTARNLESRARLTSAGFLALTFGDFGRREAERLNKQVIKGGNPGGYSALSDVEQIRAFKTFQETQGLFSRTANYAIGALGRTAQIGLGVWDLAFIGVGGAVSAELIDASNKLKERLSALSDGGWQEVINTAAIQEKYGSRAAYDHFVEQAKLVAANDQLMQKFFRDAANDIATSIVGVGGKDVLPALKFSNRFAIQAKEAEVRGDYEFSKIFREIQSRIGTKDD